MGMTNMIVWYDDDRASAYDVEVYIPSHLIEKIKESLKEHAPCAEVKPPCRHVAWFWIRTRPGNLETGN